MVSWLRLGRIPGRPPRRLTGVKWEGGLSGGNKKRRFTCRWLFVGRESDDNVIIKRVVSWGLFPSGVVRTHRLGFPFRPSVRPRKFTPFFHTPVNRVADSIFIEVTDWVIRKLGGTEIILLEFTPTLKVKEMGIDSFS